ncbi:hypothetical protein A2642_00570 [Candidatus Nomurabacteria bacterium RIFCSPHIGHO2_01_FULL_39_10]|uniref:Uncharacterized protein n=1 Tax=Candidatus Nomurabacteria bacterium RIFCSPHIGHO2_01_FULL_39_10 TaxID=1801733 RepID=A0A1F6V2W1_9BACT|nr:MAG: hypothetical protein A2642_00570 [Candidatus Nomurabacteria bacterium RIFCSPHIGHO2_01_FULL_39_10]
MENKPQPNPKEAILTGYIRYRPSNGTYYLMANSRMLCNQLISQKPIKVKVTKEDNFFIIHKVLEGNILTIRKKEIVTCISGINLLTVEERSKLMNKEHKLSFPVQVKLFPSQFNLDIYSLYPDQDAAILARKLEEKGFNIPTRIMTPKSFDHDLEFIYANKRIVIEITQTIPGKNNYLNFKHAGLGGIVRAHFLEAYHNCVNSFLSGKKDTIGFIIIHERWKEYSHITKLIPEFSKVNCHIIFSNFKDNWEEITTTQIITEIKK